MFVNLSDDGRAPATAWRSKTTLGVTMKLHIPREWILVFCGLFLLGISAGCSDDDGGRTCAVSILTINGQPADEIEELTPVDDQSVDPGFQLHLVAEIQGVADGEELSLDGGNEPMMATAADGQVEFVDYTIPTDQLVTLEVTGPAGCNVPTKSLMVRTSTMDCRFLDYEDEDSVSCSNPGDDSSNEPGLQADLAFSCTDVEDGQAVTLLRDGEVVTSGQLEMGSVSFQDVFLVGGGSECQRLVQLQAVLNTTDGTEIFPLALYAECCDSPACEIIGYLPDDPVQGLPMGDTFNISTDADTFTAGMQTQVGISTDSARVWKVGVRITSLETNETTEHYVEGITEDEVYVGASPIDLPEGDVMVEPLCVAENETEPFSYPDARQTVYVDTVRPECPTDFTCEIGNPRVAELDCQWTTPDDPNVSQDIFEWDFRFDTSFADASECTDAALEDSWTSLDTMPGSSGIAGSNYGASNVHTFEPLDPGLQYCVGVRVVDYAGNPSECVAPYWSGEIEIRRSWLNACSGEECSFGYSSTSADLNCDGIKDLVVSAPRFDAQTMIARGAVYVYFGSTQGIQSNASADLVIELTSPGELGTGLANLGNFTGHSGTESDCEDLAISAPYHDPYDSGLLLGSVFLFQGRTQWSTSMLTQNDADLAVHYDSVGAHDWEGFGVEIANVGDFNGDGRPDLGIGAPYNGSRAATYVLAGHDVGSATELFAPTDLDAKITGDATMDWSDWDPYCQDDFGLSLSPAGDLDGDGYDDFLVGAPATLPSWCFERIVGKAYIIYGGPLGPNQVQLDVRSPGDRITVIQEDTGANIINTHRIGEAVAGLGDINDDGFLDIAVSDPRYGGDTLDATEQYGAVFVFFGDASGFRGNGRIIEVDEASLWIRSQEGGKDRFGISIGSSVELPGRPMGDFDLDGVPDLFVGTQSYGESDGSVWFLYGSPSLSPVQNWINWDVASFRMTPPSPCGRWGAAISWLGDTNGDGYTDVAVGDFVYPYVCQPENGGIGRLAILY
jgi:hypothetical protein